MCEFPSLEVNLYNKITSYVVSIFDYFLHEDTLRHSSRTELLKARALVCVLIVVGISVTALLIAINHLISAFYLLFPVTLSFPAVGLYLIKKKKMLKFASIYVTLGLLIMNMAYFYTGQAFFAPQMMWWALFPIAANLFADVRFSKLVTVFLCVSLTILYFLMADPTGRFPHGVDANQLNTHYYFDSIFVIFISFLLSYIYAKAKQLNDEDLEAATEKANEAAKAKSLFLANMSHEIRTPMNGVIGMTDVLIENKNLTTEMRAQVEVIRSCGETLVNIINDILDVSKMEAGHFHMAPRKFDFHQMIQEIEVIFLRQANAKRIEFKTYVDSSVPQEVFCDDNRLTQVLMNLLGNAFKFTDHGGVKLNVFASGSGKTLKLHFRVVDSGIGIDESVKSKLFNNYIQADAEMSRTYGGTGLGLVICKRLVHLMGGNITFESVKGKGSEFEFYIQINKYHYSNTL